jgi:hypothetical protein
MLSRRAWFQAAGSVAAGALLGARLRAQVDAPVTLTVYKTPSCGCCKKWVQHMESAGFKTAIHDLSDLEEIKRTMGVPAALQGCHTALAGVYVIEGHVPADLVQKLLREKPSVRGLAVPGMPSGSPGMEGGKEPYEVVAFDRTGKTTVYARR